ncbi:MAG: acyltransferase [Bacteroidetes bacterium]|nr:acyltransferase [Bacteroidota bacterium]
MISENRIFGLDVMRAAAILMVVLGHWTWLSGFALSNFWVQVAELLSFWGVEVFFVLSGFLIGRILFDNFVNHTFTFKACKRFLMRRWFRTLPNYYLILFVNFLIADTLGYGVENGVSYFFFLQNFSSNLIDFFPESWSLSVEEWAYLLLALGLFATSVFIKKNKVKIFLILTASLWFVFVFTKVIFFKNADIFSWNEALKTVVIFRIDAILTGVLAAWLLKQYANFCLFYKNSIALLGCLVLFFLAFLLPKLGLENTNSFFWTVLYLPITSIGFACFLPLLYVWKTNKSILSKPVTYLSKISYSVYLLHYSIVLQWINYFLRGAEATGYFLINSLLYMSITIVLSAILYENYEKPMMQLRNRF